MATHSQIIEHIHHPVNFTVFDTKWIPSSARALVVGDHARGTGAIEIFEISRGKLERTGGFEVKTGVKCATFGASSLEDRSPALGDMKGGLFIYDIEAGKEKWRGSQGNGAPAHDPVGPVNCIDGCGGLAGGSGAPELVTGGRDGAVRVWDPRVEGPVASLVPESEEKARDCWTVAFGNAVGDDRCVAAGYDNGDIKMFDLRANAMLWETNVSNGVCSIEFDRRDIKMNKMVVTALEGNFAVYDLRTLNEETGFAHLSEKAHKSTVWAARHLPQNRDIFATCGGNGSVNLYKYKYPTQRSIVDKETGVETGVPGTVELLATAPLSTQPIASFDWHKDKEGLCLMGSYDQAVRVAIATRLNTA